MPSRTKPPKPLATPAPPLAERVTFLVHTIHSRIGLIGNRHFRAHDLNHYSARILVLLLEHEELRTGELVDLMVLPQSTISSQLQALHAKRLVRRRRSRKDNRSVMVTLTPAGEELARDCNGLSLRVNEQVLQGISPREAKIGLAFMHKVQQRLLQLEAQDAALYPFHGPGQLERLNAGQAVPRARPARRGKT